MPDIKYKSTSCGPAGSFQPEDIRFGVPEEEAAALVEGGYAVYVHSAPREQAVVAPVEHAVSPAMPVIPQPQAGRTPPRRGGR
jgi:hypothetical protein